MGLLDIAILVFREGLECVLVLAALTANMAGRRSAYQKPVYLGVLVGAGATCLTWALVVGIVRDLSADLPALELQAGTGLLAVLVLLLVMNWFFHRVYWTGWISMHSRQKEAALRSMASSRAFNPTAWWTLGLLGFSAFYREGFEVVLFLQSYRLRFGGRVVGYGLLIGIALTVATAAATFIAHRKLPYRKMLVLTGVLLGFVLLVMVGEEAQEMQLCGWLSITRIEWLARSLPEWAGTWLSLFPTVETIAAQAVAAALVLLSYAVARPKSGVPVGPVRDGA